MALQLRRATEQDVDLIYHWANDPEVRKNSFQSDPIPYPNHCAWFFKKVVANSVAYYILENGHVPLGQIRYEIEVDVALTNYSISKEHRGQGLGNRIIALAEKQLMQDFPAVSKIIAYVKPENIASANIFRKLNYVESYNGDELAFEKRVSH